MSHSVSIQTSPSLQSCVSKTQPMVTSQLSAVHSSPSAQVSCAKIILVLGRRVLGARYHRHTPPVQTNNPRTDHMYRWYTHWVIATLWRENTAVEFPQVSVYRHSRHHKIPGRWCSQSIHHIHRLYKGYRHRNPPCHSSVTESHVWFVQHSVLTIHHRPQA